MKIKINGGKSKPVLQARPGDIAYFNDDYWLIGIWDENFGSDNKYYFVSLTMANKAWIKPCDLTEYLEIRKAIIFDGSESSLNLITRKPVIQKVPDDKDEQVNVPSPYESNENDEGNTKPCKYCDHSEPRISGKAPSHYIYIDSSNKELVDVCDGNKTRKISRVGIKYCPFCRRKL